MKLLKAQHPDYEEYSSDVHASAGVTCAACHMPVVTTGRKRATSHWITSPLQRTGAQAIARAHGAIAGAAAARIADPGSLAQARQTLRKAQWFWEFISSANSTGFHDPVLAQNTLAQSVSLANEATLLAWQAASRPVGER